MDSITTSLQELDSGAVLAYKIREAWVNNFSFLAHASFYVPRWAIGLALNIKQSADPVWGCATVLHFWA